MSDDYTGYSSVESDGEVVSKQLFSHSGQEGTGLNAAGVVEIKTDPSVLMRKSSKDTPPATARASARSGGLPMKWGGKKLVVVQS